MTNVVHSSSAFQSVIFQSVIVQSCKFQSPRLSNGQAYVYRHRRSTGSRVAWWRARNEDGALNYTQCPSRRVNAPVQKYNILTYDQGCAGFAFSISCWSGAGVGFVEISMKEDNPRTMKR